MNEALPVGLRPKRSPCPKLRISIVTYAPDNAILRKTVTSLERSVAGLTDFLVDLTLIDNGPSGSEASLRSLFLDVRLSTKVLSGQGNVGYGQGHNLAISGDSDYHLILNPDVELAENALVNALAFMREHLACGLLSPSVLDGSGGHQYLCKRYPTILDLALRGFSPAWLKRQFAERLARYEMRDQIGDKVVWNPPIVSGCFMLFKTEVLRALDGFDSRYFLYFEDFDLSLRAGLISQVAYVPTVRIVHHGGHASRKGWQHLKMFFASAIKFFNQHGWRWW